MMVAAHNDDFRAAASLALGSRTAFGHRPTEYGPEQTTNLRAVDDYDIVAEVFIELADRPGA